MEKTEAPKKKINFASYAVVVGFLCLEILAFVSFNLGHSLILFGSLAIALTALLVLVTFRQISVDGISTYAFFIFPIFVYGLLTALSSFNYYSVGAIGLADSIFVPIALTFMSAAGFFSSYIKELKLKHMMLVIYSALAIFVFINLFITMIYYVPFYTLIYRNYYIFYEGKPSSLPIGEMAYMLFGFKIETVSLLYWTLYPSLLMTAVVPLFFIKFKENKKEFLAYLVFTIIAGLSLLFTISKITLISDAILLLGLAMIIIAAKFHQSRKIFDTAMIVIGIIILIVLIVIFIIAQTNWGFTEGLRNLISKNSLLSRLFMTNRFAKSIFTIFQMLFSTLKFFGVPVGLDASAYADDNTTLFVQQNCSNMWLFDNLLSSGFFGAVFFFAALVIGIRRLFKYIKHSEDSDCYKYLIVAYILGFLVISLIAYDYTPLTTSSHLFPIYTSAPLLICLFLLSFAFNRTPFGQSSKKIKEVAKEEKEEEGEDEVINI